MIAVGRRLRVPSRVVLNGRGRYVDRAGGRARRTDPSVTPPGLDSSWMLATAALTGDDLRVEDVWQVAVEGAHAELTDGARAKMRAAREVVEAAAHGVHEHTYGV